MVQPDAPGRFVAASQSRFGEGKDRLYIVQVIQESSAAANQVVLVIFDPNFRLRGVAEEAQRARCACIRSSLKDSHQVADVGLRKRYRTAESIQRRTKRTDNIDLFN